MNREVIPKIVSPKKQLSKSLTISVSSKAKFTLLQTDLLRILSIAFYLCIHIVTARKHKMQSGTICKINCNKTDTKNENQNSQGK